MATESIDIRIREDGSRVVRRNIEDVGDSSRKAASGVDLLKKALAGLGIGVVLHELIQIADTYTNIENRLRTVTSSTAELNVVNRELLAIANQTRQSYEGTVEVYTRMAGATKALGLSQREVLDFQLQLNEAVALSGAKSEEAKNALIQLAQGLGAGALRGDELNSVLEQLPTVADIISKQLGVTRGQLKGLAEDGKITAKTVIDAFKTAAPELEQNFGKAVPTIAQGFTVLKNQLTATVGAFLNGQGAASGFANALLYIAKNIDPVLRGMSALAIVIGVTLAADAIPKAIAGMRTLTLAIGAIAVALTTIIALLITFSDQIQIGGEHIANLQDLAVAAWGFIQQGLGQLIDYFNEHFGWIRDYARSVFGDVELSVAGLLTAYATYMDNIIGVTQGSYRAIVAAFTGLPDAMRDLFARAFNSSVDVVESFINGMVGALNTVLEYTNLDKLQPVQIQRASQVGADLGKSVGDAFQSGLGYSGAKDAVNTLMNAADEVARQRLEKEKKLAEETAAAREGLDKKGTATPIPDPKRVQALEQINRQLDSQLKLMGMFGPAYEVQKEFDRITNSLHEKKITLTKAESDAIRKKIELLQQQTQVQEQINRIYQEALGPELEYNATIEAANKLLAAGAITQAQHAQQVTKATEAYRSAKDPLYETNRQLDQQRQLLGILGPARQVEQQMQQIQNELLQKGVVLNQEQTKALRDKLTTMSQEQAVSQQLDTIYSETVGKKQELADKTTALNMAYQQGMLSLEQYQIRMNNLGLAAANLRMQMGDASFLDVFNSSLGQLVAGYEGVLPGLSQSFGNFFQSLTDGFADSIGKAVVYSQSLGEALQKIAQEAVAGLISALIKLGIQYAITAALGESMGATNIAMAAAETEVRIAGAMAVAMAKIEADAMVLAASSAMAMEAAAINVGLAMATAAAWAPAAALVSLATFGMNAAPAIAAIEVTAAVAESTAMLSMLGGFEQGGYTGDVGRKQIAGVVHGQEFVVNAAATARNRDVLEAMNSGAVVGPVSTGSTKSSAGSNGTAFNVYVENYTSADIQVERLSETDVRIIAREEAQAVVRKDAPGIVASNIANPNSDVSKSLDRYTNTQRKR